MSGDRKHNRNRDFCKLYKISDTEATNRRRRHRTLVSRLEKKRARMQAKNRDVAGITKTIQHHESLSRGRP